uniref:Uncharacterized protein n=2 Tax=viral metagenome TaxID=1070528 RepID=A0A6M3J6M1_9ZZZZ
MPVRMMLQSLDSRELSEWQAYFFIVNEEMEKEMTKQKDTGGIKVMEAGLQSGIAGASAYNKARKRR